ncbi:Uncharacterised protein [Mycobacterium tuberculosis]|uniref:Uncharacterized protein n=1 Tax=Mycobacterium tuberculosis TaxID=1773 RepID=A0A0T7PSG4_MYCTX|nr:Uncharacterised protein [Mycobacterium tuberculosis]COX24763.1 Uncharacterised protein [Mycobacterium tuberculosis]COX53622.1 Uncharacterised protein [Mycobacterium tuberculosis]COY66121.1 Uncharacterised protein [Mycobacterium tuberculosis]COZ85606.1 Uncharacterised protein [Mycobacterium tuberculosis]
MSAAPTKMNPVRVTSANAIPNNSTFCCARRGTPKLLMMTRNTNRLSTDRASSVR